MSRTFPIFILLILSLSLAAAGCSNPSGEAASVSQNAQASTPVGEYLPQETSPQQTPDSQDTVDPAILEASRTPISYSQSRPVIHNAISSGQETPMGMPLGMTLSSAATGNENSDGALTEMELALSVEKQTLTKAELSAKKVGLILVRKIVVAEVPTRKPIEQKKASTGRSPRTPSSGPNPTPTPMKKLR